jgi:transcription-repair coupling factor (superfamily II helicase)
MDLPKLSPGKRFTLPRPPGSADALLLARLAEREKAGQRRTAIVTADASDAQRLIDEMAFFAPELRCALFPDWETLPYDQFSPHQDLISERLATLWRIGQKDAAQGADVVLVPATTALYRLAPPAFLAGYTFHFKVKQKLDEAQLRAQLTLAGYQHVTQVVSPGEYAVRGGLIDLFPMGSLQPYRVDLFDDEIDSIRTFDPDSQRSLYPVPEVRLLPGREFPMDDAARARFRSRWRELLEGDPTRSRIYKDMGNGVATAGIEYYLPLFFEDTATVFDYLGSDATVVLHGDLEAAFQRFWQDTRERHRLLQGDPERPMLPPEALFLSAEQFYTRASRTPSSRCAPAGWRICPTVRFSSPWPTWPWCAVPKTRWSACTQHIRNTQQRVLVLAESDGRRESLLDFLARLAASNPPAFDSLAEFQASTEEKVGIATAALATGFRWVEEGVDFVTETELFAAGPTTRRRKKQEQVSDVEALIKDLSRTQRGRPGGAQPARHWPLPGPGQHGRGQQAPTATPELQEFLHLEYAGEATLYVPVSQLQLISRYTGVSADEAPLHKLGSGQWEKAKRKAAEQVRDSAAELLNIYARRAAREGHAFRYSTSTTTSTFANDFGFEETADQNAAIHAVIQDMISPRAHGPPGLRRRGFWQDRGRPARRLCGRHRRQTGGLFGPHHAAGRAALPDAGGPLWQVAGEGGRDLAAFAPARRSPPPSRALPTARWTSWSARTSCCPSPPSSTTWACSSSTRSTASACATRSR